MIPFSPAYRAARTALHIKCTLVHTHTLALMDSGPEHTAKVFHNTISVRESRIELVGEKTKENEQMKERE